MATVLICHDPNRDDLAKFGATAARNSRVHSPGVPYVTKNGQNVGLMFSKAVYVEGEFDPKEWVAAGIECTAVRRNASDVVEEDKPKRKKVTKKRGRPRKKVVADGDS